MPLPYDLASRAAAELRISIYRGWWLRDVAGCRTKIAAGSDKVSVNSAAVRNPDLITAAATAFGSQAVICAIDAKRVGEPGPSRSGSLGSISGRWT